ncbi:MAG: hypothetical protein NZ954_03585 [Thermofilaceae archaeon]|nr:hypothetical protein [Thermofilaceae archaeon]MDW8004857.1 hypothetical protein [Thermofilaceae archaeon]
MGHEADLTALTLGVCGAVLAVYSYWILSSIPFTALGIGMMIVAASIFTTYREAPYSDAVAAILEAYTENLARILEEFNAPSKVTYVKGNKVVIPLTNPPPKLEEVAYDRLISGSRGNYALILATPKLDLEPGDPEAVLTHVLVDSLGLCDNVRVVTTGDQIIVELVKPREPKSSARFSEVLGPVAAHVASSLLAEALDKPLRLEEWKREGKNVTVTLRVVEDAGER